MSNDLAFTDPQSLARQDVSAMDIATTQAAQTIQAMCVMAKKFPRDENAAYLRIMQACKRPALAEHATYSFPRGGQTVDGPSIRLAEVLLRSWGNCEAGVIELERKKGESIAMAYAMDYETNSRDVKVFSVKHERHKRGGVVERLTDERDIYELVANGGARRKRACILSLIPSDVVDDALAQCEKTLAGQNSEPLADRVRRMLAGFSEFGVTQGMIEGRLGHKLEAITEREMVDLRKVYTSLKDGMSPREQWFHVESLQVGKSGPAAPPKTLDDVVAKATSAPDPVNPVEENPAPALDPEAQEDLQAAVAKSMATGAPKRDLSREKQALAAAREAEQKKPADGKML